MTQETINLIIGAAIAILSSLFTIVVTELFDIRKRKQERSWQTSDQRRQTKLDIFNRRYEQIDSKIEPMSMACMEMYNAITTALNEYKSGICDIKKLKKEMLVSLAKFHSHSQFDVALYSTGDEELFNIASSIGNIIDSVIIQGVEVTNLNKSDEQELWNYLETLGDKIAQILNEFGKICSRLDYLRINI